MKARVGAGPGPNQRVPVRLCAAHGPACACRWDGIPEFSHGNQSMKRMAARTQAMSDDLAVGGVCARE